MLFFITEVSRQLTIEKVFYFPSNQIKYSDFITLRGKKNLNPAKRTILHHGLRVQYYLDVTIPQHFFRYVYIVNVLKEGKQKHIGINVAKLLNPFSS